MSKSSSRNDFLFFSFNKGKVESINEPDVWEENTELHYNINGDIEFKDVNFYYPARKEAPVLRNLSLIARTGQTTALVGSSGCGKYSSTTKRRIC